MSNSLTIIVSGKKQAGKSTTSAHIIAKMLRRKRPYANDITYSIDDEANVLVKTKYSINVVSRSYLEKDGIKLYSFADPLKRFCIDVLGVPETSCYGTDEQKNAPIDHLRWENLPLGLRPGEGDFLDVMNQTIWPSYRKGPMSGRELMQVFGTDLCRRLYGDCWAMGTYNTIKREGFELAIVCDGRFPNEMDLGSTVNAKTIRLLRAPFADDKHKSETALDDYPLEKYSYVLDNREMNVQQQSEALDPIIEEWFNAALK